MLLWQGSTKSGEITIIWYPDLNSVEQIWANMNLVAEKNMADETFVSIMQEN
jgi:hypothetical protein